MRDNHTRDLLEEPDNDSLVDMLSAIALVLIPVIGIVFWLSGLPTS